MTGTKVTVETIRAMKARGEKIAALTAYDFPMTRLLDEADIVDAVPEGGRVRLV